MNMTLNNRRIGGLAKVTAGTLLAVLMFASQPAVAFTLSDVQDFTTWNCFTGMCKISNEIDNGASFCNTNAYAGLAQTGTTADGTITLNWNPNKVGQTAWKQFYVNFRYDHSTSLHKVVFDVQANQIRFTDGLSGTAVSFTYGAVQYKFAISHSNGAVSVTVNNSLSPVASATYTSSDAATKYAISGADDGSCHTVSNIAGPGIDSKFHWKQVSGPTTYNGAVKLCASNAYSGIQYAGTFSGDGQIEFKWNPNQVGQSQWKQLYVEFRPPHGASSHRVVFALDDPTPRIRFDSGLSGSAVNFNFAVQTYDVVITHTLGSVTVSMDGGSTTTASATYLAAETETGLTISAADNGSCHSITYTNYQV